MDHAVDGIRCVRFSCVSTGVWSHESATSPCKITSIDLFDYPERLGRNGLLRCTIPPHCTSNTRPLGRRLETPIPLARESGLREGIAEDDVPAAVKN
eukprot:scaffold189_cov249-Pinguiococcus_pyrenoidosus.AAC.13